MMEKKYYVFRIDNENKTNIYQFAKCNHELRQGWGELLRENPAFNLNVEQGKRSSVSAGKRFGEKMMLIINIWRGSIIIFAK